MTEKPENLIAVIKTGLPSEVREAQKQFEKYWHKICADKSRGRPPKGQDKYREISIRLHPKALQWARTQAKLRGIGYQTFINQMLLHHGV